MKKEILRTICECANMYDKNLKGKNLMFIFTDDNKKIKFIETQFLANNFKHLTGVESKNIKSSLQFYKLCLNNKLSYKEIVIKQNGTTRLKLNVLPQLINIARNAKVIADYDSSKINLYTDKLIGGIHCCIGFIKKDKYYLPNTIIKEDIRQISRNKTNTIVAILEKTTVQKQYNIITYKNDKIDINILLNDRNIEKKINKATLVTI